MNKPRSNSFALIAASAENPKVRRGVIATQTFRVAMVKLQSMSRAALLADLVPLKDLSFKR